MRSLQGYTKKMGGAMMGFKDFLSSAGAVTLEAMRQRQQRIQDYKERLDGYDTDRLIREYKRASGEKLFAITMLLKERGVTKDDFE